MNPIKSLLALVAIASTVAGCTTARTEVTRETVMTNGVVIRDSTTTQMRIFADGKNKLSDFKASQTKSGSQLIGIGEQSGESTSEVVSQFMNGVMMLGRLGVMMQGIPLPEPEPVPAKPRPAIPLPSSIQIGTNQPVPIPR